MTADGSLEAPLEAAPDATPAIPSGGPECAFSAELVMLSPRPDVRAEAIRALRTYVLAQHIRAGRRALAVCAASADVGCTFIAANLAVALSQIGVKTLLIDADLHAPGVGGLIRPQRTVEGLARYLTSPRMGTAEVIVPDVLPDLSVMFAGGPAPNPQELLGGERFRDLMAICLRDFEATIIDTPPANRWSDARRVSAVAGYSLIVAAKDKTFVDDVRILAEQLQADHARVVGTVLNEA